MEGLAPVGPEEPATRDKWLQPLSAVARLFPSVVERGRGSNGSRATSQMAPYSLNSALLLTRADRALVKSSA